MTGFSRSALAAIAVIAITSGAKAEVRDFGTAGGYEVSGKASTFEEAGLCIAEFVYDGPGSTKTTISRSADAGFTDFVFFTVVNFEWSAKEDAKYDLLYYFNDVNYERQANGVVIDRIYRGFIAPFPAQDFLGHFDRSSFLNIYMGDTVVDRLSLKGSTAGVALFNKCWSWLVTTERAAQAERDKFKDIPRDPFAKKDKGDE